MEHGILKVSAVGPKTVLGSPERNAETAVRELRAAKERGVELLVFPELFLTGASAGDLFFRRDLFDQAAKAADAIRRATAPAGSVKISNCAASSCGDPLRVIPVPKRFEPDGTARADRTPGLSGGDTDGADGSGCPVRSGGLSGILALIGYPALLDGVPAVVTELLGNGRVYLRSVKKNLHGDGLLDFARWFRSPDEPDLIFKAGEASIAVVPYSDLFSADPRIFAETNLVLCPAALRSTAGADERIARELRAFSERNRAAVVFANAGEGESTTDGLFAGGVKIYENGELLAASPLGSDAPSDAELDLGALAFRKRREGSTSFADVRADRVFEDGVFPATVFLSRKIPKFPFVSPNFVAQATEIFDIQAESLKRRLAFVRAETAVVGVSGGLDSTLALLVSVEAVKRAGLAPANVLAVTSPGAGTSDRTYRNATRLMSLLGVEQKEIPIAEAVGTHLRDLGHAGEADVAYENAQSRERMQILMDLANMRRGLVVGTGDLSELASGFTTYNGDHMAMYGVNASVPKTLLRSVVKVIAERAGGDLGKVLSDIVETPVSPELKPSKDGQIAQFTESVVGPYELVDFFLYHFFTNGADAEKILFLAKRAFGESYPEDKLKRCLNGFLKRFFASEFKRTCMPDGADATGCSLSPRGGFALGADTGSEPFLFV